MRTNQPQATFQAQGVIASYEQAIRNGDSNSKRLIRQANLDLTKHFDESDKTIHQNG